MGAMIADCRQCEQRQPSAAANLGSFGAKAKFGSAGNLCKKICRRGLRTHITFARALPGPTPTPLRMLMIPELMISTLTISTLSMLQRSIGATGRLDGLPHGLPTARARLPGGLPHGPETPKNGP